MPRTKQYKEERVAYRLQINKRVWEQFKLRCAENEETIVDAINDLILESFNRPPREQSPAERLRHGKEN